MTEEKQLKNLKLHERIVKNFPEHKVIILKVSGGFIYTTESIYGGAMTVSSVYVPELRKN